MKNLIKNSNIYDSNIKSHNLVTICQICKYIQKNFSEIIHEKNITD